MFKHGFPPEWSTLKKLIWLVGSGIAGAASGIWKTVTGTLIHITDALASPMQKCEVTLEPVQAGSGDPSPTNVRPITGWTGCEVWVKDEYDTSLPATASVTFPDTVYGGKYEFVSGEGEDEFANIIVNGDVNISIPYATYIGENASRCYVNFETITGKKRQTSPAVDKCNMLKYSPYFADLERVESVYGRDGTSLVMIKLPNSITGIESTDSTSIAIAKFKAYFGSNPLQYTYKVAESAEFPLTPQEISTLKGVNNVWSNTNGNTTVIYKAQAE